MRESRKGFTLAEVLVTLAIIGVVAALTIPTLITNTNSARYSAGLKKAISTLDSAIQTNQSATSASDASNSGIVDAATLTNWFVYGLAATDAALPATLPTPNVAFLKKVAASGDVWLADGSRLHFVGPNSGTGCATAQLPQTYNASQANTCYVVVDVNGDALPNTASTGGPGTPVASDIWVLGITQFSVVPINLTTTNITNTALVNAGNTTGTYTATANITAPNNASLTALTGGT